MKIIKETTKAKLIELDNIQFWVKNSWLKSDGTLTPAGFKSYEEAKADYDYYSNYNALNHFEKLRETEKAILVNVQIELCNIEKVVDRDMWLPKSMVTNYKFVMNKINELFDTFPAGTGCCLAH
jgi:hypothetical protein